MPDAGRTGPNRGRQLERTDGRGQSVAREAEAKRAQARRRQADTGELDEAPTIQFHCHTLPRNSATGERAWYRMSAG